MSLFKSKKNSESKLSSKSSTESESKDKKQSSSSTTTKSGASNSAAAVPPSTSSAGGGGATASKSKLNAMKERSASIDITQWQESDIPLDNRIKASTMHGNSNTLSISRSGRFKAKGKTRARLFSDDATGDISSGCQGEGQDSSAPGSRVPHTLSTPEDRQTVLQAMAMRAGTSPTTATKSSPNTTQTTTTSPSSSKWSATTHSTDL